MVALLANIPPPPLRGDDGMTTFDIGPVSIAAYGVMIAVGALIAMQIIVRRYSSMGGEGDLAERTALVALAAAIVGSRIGYILPRLDHFLANPALIPQIWRGGLAFFGGVALAVPVTWWYVRSRGGDIARMIDAVAPALPVGHAIGRWGNYFNQELFGRPTELPWALQVESHRIPVHVSARFPGATTFHPTFLYESLWNLALAVTLIIIDRRQAAREARRLRRGTLGFIYLVGYGLGRLGMEQLRVDTAERYLGLSRNSWVALLVIVLGIAGALWWQHRSPVDADASVAESAGPEGIDPTNPGSDHRQDTGGAQGQDPSPEDPTA